jgi:hypothetical protein
LEITGEVAFRVRNADAIVVRRGVQDVYLKATNGVYALKYVTREEVYLRSSETSRTMMAFRSRTPKGSNTINTTRFAWQRPSTRITTMTPCQCTERRTAGCGMYPRGILGYWVTVHSEWRCAENTNGSFTDPDSGICNKPWYQ